MGPHCSPSAGQTLRLATVFGVTAAVLLIELIGGVLANSLALVADAAHVAADLVGIGLALGAIWIAGRPPSDERTFGFYRVEILAAVANALLLFAIAAYVLWEAWQRVSSPPPVATGLMLGVALIGGVGNLVSLRLLHAGQKESINVRGAYLEVLGDLLGSIAVIVAAVVIVLTGLTIADTVASVAIAVFIVPRTWGLLRDAVDILLEATPRGVRLAEVRDHLSRAEGVVDVHDLHVWTITSGMKVASAHVVLRDGARPGDVLHELNQCLAGDFDVEHSTIQLETEDRRRFEEAHHA